MGPNLNAGRRLFLVRSLASIALGAISAQFLRSAVAHTPYRQWAVYRKKHLIIGTCRADPESYPFGKQIALLLSKELPESKARVTRAPDQQRLASLITTGQLEVILLTHQEGRQLRSGAPPFHDYGPFGVQTVFEFDTYLLLGSDSLPEYHAWIIARTLAQALDRPPLLGSNPLSVPVHPGTSALVEGKTLEPDAPGQEAAEEVDHFHQP